MIDSFSGKYRFLSNFYLCPVTGIDGITYPSSEHAYQAAKTDDFELRKTVLYMSPGQVKRWGGNLKEIIPDWNKKRYFVMLTIVRQKFMENAELEKLLIETGDEELIEGNTWQDFYWGVCNGVGQNNLGKILMQVRNELKPGIVEIALDLP